MKILVIPDTQVTPTSNTDHLKWAGMYAAEKQPEHIVHLGDHFDMQSLSSYDVGKMSFEGRRYVDDIRAGVDALCVFDAPILRLQKSQRRAKKSIWRPNKHFLLGNHEDRIDRIVMADRKLEGFMSTRDFQLEEMGWEVHSYLDLLIIEDIVFSHFFVSGVMGRPCCSARSLLMKKHMSCVMGHVQDRDIAYAKKANNTRITGLFAGIFYQEDQAYLNPQTNGSWTGIWMLNECVDGSFDELPISINYLRDKYK